ncbi:hypothetical protein [Deinococcus sp.]|uniref:hypothetical protein n=1 Tax=Deinococcus sp. TaxID=47478 RepID=UPI003C7DAD8D
MRPATFVPLISALVLALITLPLLVSFLPIGLACLIASLLLAVLAVPGLVEHDRLRGQNDLAAE